MQALSRHVQFLAHTHTHTHGQLFRLLLRSPTPLGRSHRQNLVCICLSMGRSACCNLGLCLFFCCEVAMHSSTPAVRWYVLTFFECMLCCVRACACVRGRALQKRKRVACSRLVWGERQRCVRACVHAQRRKKCVCMACFCVPDEKPLFLSFP